VPQKKVLRHASNPRAQRLERTTLKLANASIENINTTEHRPKKVIQKRANSLEQPTFVIGSLSACIKK
jgi:hypothetical protein